MLLFRSTSKERRSLSIRAIFPSQYLTGAGQRDQPDTLAHAWPILQPPRTQTTATPVDARFITKLLEHSLLASVADKTAAQPLTWLHHTSNNAPTFHNRHTLSTPYPLPTTWQHRAREHQYQQDSCRAPLLTPNDFAPQAGLSLFTPPSHLYPSHSNSSVQYHQHNGTLSSSNSRST